MRYIRTRNRPAAGLCCPIRRVICQNNIQAQAERNLELQTKHAEMLEAAVSDGKLRFDEMAERKRLFSAVCRQRTVDGSRLDLRVASDTTSMGRCHRGYCSVLRRPSVYVRRICRRHSAFVKTRSTLGWRSSAGAKACSQPGRRSASRSKRKTHRCRQWLPTHVCTHLLREGKTHRYRHRLPTHVCAHLLREGTTHRYRQWLPTNVCTHLLREGTTHRFRSVVQSCSTSWWPRREQLVSCSTMLSR